MRRKNWKKHFANSLYEKKQLNKKLLFIMKSFDEVKKLLNPPLQK